MFEVQLGAAVFIQFKTVDGNVNVLADAGVKASSYPVDAVHKRLLKILDDTGGRRIDLIVGTHYDEDHLNGLVPIIDDRSIDIGEAWMPPVANDVGTRALDAAVQMRDLLPFQFYEDEAGIRLGNYLSEKRTVIEQVDNAISEDRGLFARQAEPEYGSFDGDEKPDTYFRKVLRSVHEQTADDHDQCDHCDSDVDPDRELSRTIPYDWRFRFNPELTLTFDSDAKIAVSQFGTLNNIKKSAAKGAINAVALHDVMQALSRRQLLVHCQIIDDGIPRAYVWNRKNKRFLPGVTNDGLPTLTLLGPSRSLVRKHLDKLPVAEAIQLAFRYTGEIKSITPSNQLSYVLRFSFSGQGLLITGDAGMVDFKERRGEYHAALLEALLPLHVVQVAHHGGANAHFYNVLSAACFPEQRDRSYLLLSHAVSDKHRPSLEFRNFVLASQRYGDDITTLFTSVPKLEKVLGIEGTIHPVVGRRDQVGDIKLVYEDGEWEVRNHSVAI